MKQDKKKSLFWSPLAISLVLHALLLLIQTSFQSVHDFEPQKQPIEITQVPPEVIEQLARQQQKKKKIPKQKRQNQIVETEKGMETDTPPDTAFLGEKNQIAQQEMRAKKIDEFQKKTGSGPKAEKKGEVPQSPPKGAEDGETSSPLDIGDVAALKKKGAKRDWKDLSLGDLSVGGEGGLTGSTDDFLDDVNVGDRTILSTREFRYYSYYHRIKQLLRQHWKPSVQKRLAHLWRRGKTLSQNDMTTKLLVLLNEQGRIAKISRVTASGIREVDDAAIEAFNLAAPFPNPPKGIVDPDGFVRIRWDFILRAAAAPKIQFRRVGSRPQNRLR